MHLSISIKLRGILRPKSVRRTLVAAEAGIIFVGRHEVRKLVLKIDYHVTEETRGDEKGTNQQLLIRWK